MNYKRQQQSNWGINGQFEEDLFEEFQSFINEKEALKNKKKSDRGEDITLKLDVSFMEAVNGATKYIKMKKTIKCPTCKGSRCKEGTNPSKCYKCGGSGMVTIRKGIMDVHMACLICQGTGDLVRHACVDCRGIGVKKMEVNEEISIPQGINQGQNLKVIGRVKKKTEFI